MGTRGYRVTRFRGRYYRFYSWCNSFPSNLGKRIVSEIPLAPEAYRQWLAERRKEALEWHVAVERFLCRERAYYEDNDEDTNELDDSQDTTENEHPWGVATGTLPDFNPPFNDLYIEWVYIIDLDNEVFTINNSAHLHLNRIPHCKWRRAIHTDDGGDCLLLPDGSVPDETIADLVVKPPATNVPSMLNMQGNLDITFVKAKGLNAFPPMQRHGPLLRSVLFNFL